MSEVNLPRVLRLQGWFFFFNYNLLIMSLIPSSPHSSASHCRPSTLVTIHCFISPYCPNQYATLLALCSFFPPVEKKDPLIAFKPDSPLFICKGPYQPPFHWNLLLPCSPESAHTNSLSISLALNVSMRHLNICTIEFVLSHVMCKCYPYPAISIHQNYR